MKNYGKIGISSSKEFKDRKISASGNGLPQGVGDSQ